MRRVCQIKSLLTEKAGLARVKLTCLFAIHKGRSAGCSNRILQVRLEHQHSSALLKSLWTD